MKYLIDTNVLLRLCDKNSAQHPIIRTAIRSLRQQGHELYTLPQNCTEFWNVATRPQDKNGFGFSVEQTARLLKLIERLFLVIPDIPDIYPQWKKLIFQFKVKGVQVHDARIVAAMKVHKITHILTFNTDDFKRYLNENITTVNPKNFC